MAARLVTVQLGVSFLLALLFLAQGLRPALAALAGGGLVVAGTALFAARLFANGSLSTGILAAAIDFRAMRPARGALLCFIAGTALKWLVLLGGLYALLGVLQLPPLPVLAGFAAVLLSHLAAARFSD